MESWDLLQSFCLRFDLLPFTVYITHFNVKQSLCLFYCKVGGIHNLDTKKNKGKTLVKLAKKGNDSVKGRCEGFSLATFGISKKRIEEDAPKIVVKAI